MQTLNRFLHEFVELFERLGLPYVIIGGFAVRVHAIPRPTYDLDFTLNLDQSDTGTLFNAIEEEGWDIPEEYRRGWTDAIGEERWNLFSARTFLEGHSIVVDFFVADNEFLRSVLDRRVLCDYDNHQYWFATPEDLILLKLCANRPRDWLDIADVVFMQGQLDDAYLRHWAERLGVLDRLDKALAQPPNYGDGP